MLRLYDRAPVAQVDRAAGFEPVGREFESLRARQKAKALKVQFNFAESGLVATGDNAPSILTAVSRLVSSSKCPYTVKSERDGAMTEQLAYSP